VTNDYFKKSSSQMQQIEALIKLSEMQRDKATIPTWVIAERTHPDPSLN